jgi:hypothetical protein
MTIKKLRLSKETLKSLSEPQLNEVVAGIIGNSDFICTLLECSWFCPTLPP